MTELQERLVALRDDRYAVFQRSLIPTIPPECIIGIRMPVLRTFAKKFRKESSCSGFLRTLPHSYYEENMLHAILLTMMSDEDQCMTETEAFLPYIDNWAVCDCLAPKVFSKHLSVLFPQIEKWVASEHPYVCRFGIGMLMRHFLDDEFRPEYLKIPAQVRSDAYYVKMMVAWFFATALAKQWADTVPYLQEKKLDVWTHNKTIQKACESYRISAEKKECLRAMKRKQIGSLRLLVGAEF